LFVVGAKLGGEIGSRLPLRFRRQVRDAHGERHAFLLAQADDPAARAAFHFTFHAPNLPEATLSNR
jgi:hypothetical protein